MSEHEKLVTKSLMQLMRDCDAYFHNGEIVTRGALEISTWRECERRAKAVVEKEEG